MGTRSATWGLASALLISAKSIRYTHPTERMAAHAWRMHYGLASYASGARRTRRQS